MGVLHVEHHWGRLENGGTAPLEASQDEEQMVLTLRTQDQGEREQNRAYMNLVIVVDISGSMGRGGKLKKVRETIKGIINGEWPTTEGNNKKEKWLRGLDRLCIITFESKAEPLFDMKVMSQENRNKALSAVENLQAHGNTNMQHGLQLAVDKIKQFDEKERASAIILLSDGAENIGHAREVPVDHVPVETVGFGTDHENMVLQDISLKSNGGHFSNCSDPGQLIQVISPLLHYRKHIVIKDLELTLKHRPRMSVAVDFGSYRQDTSQPGIKTIYAGSLQGGRKYTVRVRFYLPPAEREIKETVMTYQWKYWSLVGVAQEEQSPIVTIEINRTQGAGRRNRALIVNHVVPKEVRTEETRLNHLAMIKQVRRMADEGKFAEAQDTLADGMGKLDDLRCLTNSDVSINVIKLLYAEVQEIFRVVESEDKYKNRCGQSYVAACISSHERQRYAARGDEGCRVRLFTTDRMNDYLNDAIKLDNMARNA